MPDRLVVSWTTTWNPAARTCSTHFVQQPHVALLYTVIRGPGGRAAPVRASGAPLEMRAATPTATGIHVVLGGTGCKEPRGRSLGDRKSTRLNSSHLVISYAVFC